MEECLAGSEVATVGTAGWAVDLVDLLRGSGGWCSASPGTAFLWAVVLPLSYLSNIKPFSDESFELEGWFVSFFLIFVFFPFLSFFLGYKHRHIFPHILFDFLTEFFQD